MSDQLTNLLIGLGGGAVAVIMAALFARRKTAAETTDIITQAAQRVLIQVQARADNLEAEIGAVRAASTAAQHRLENEIVVLASAVRALAVMVRDLGGDPSPVMVDVNMNGWRT